MNNPKDECFHFELNSIFVKHFLLIAGEFKSLVSSSEAKSFENNCSLVEDSLGKQMLFCAKPNESER